MKQLWLIACLGLAACGGDDDDEILQEIYAYDRSAPYSESLVECVRAYQDDESCYLDVLPPLNRTNSTVTVDQIMQRVVVSHDWMAERFREVLELAPTGALEMFSPLTAVVISYDIIPAFYTINTGAIYIDPRYLWTTPAEYATIEQKEDYRSGFDDSLSLTTYYWYEDQSGYRLSLNNTPENPDYRSISSVTTNIMRLFFHELAHANDFLPPGQRTAIRLPAGDASYYDAVNEAWQDGDMVQQQLNELSNTTLLDLADVMYRGEEPTAYLMNLGASEAGGFFETEGASDHYAYSTPAEDVAMLAEETLMSYSYGAKRSVFFLDNAGEGSACYYDVGWGQEGRIAATLVKPRAKQVIAQMLPSMATELMEHLDSLADPSYYPVGRDICSLIPTSPSSFSTSAGSSGESLEIEPRHKPMELPF